MENSKMSTNTFNLTPDASLLERIKRAARGDHDASIDLAYANILYDDKRDAERYARYTESVEVGA
jgi:hypothetical protein